MFPETLKRSSKYPPKISKYSEKLSKYLAIITINIIILTQKKQQEPMETDISVIVVVFQFHGIFEY